VRTLILTIILELGILSLAGCAGSKRCLQTPVSSKVTQEEVSRCEAWLQKNLDRSDLFDRTIQLLHARGEFGKMRRWSRKVLEHDEQRADARFFLAVSLRKLGRCEQAVEHYRRYAKINESDADPYYGIGLCQEALGDSRAAITAFRSYIDKEQRPSRRSWRDRASARVAALSGGGVVAAAPPRRPSVIRTRAPTRTAKPPRAARPAPRLLKPRPNCGALAKKVKSDPFATAAYDRLAGCLASRGEHAKVIKRMLMAIRDNPSFTRGWLRLGDAYRALGRAAAAKRAFARACKGGLPEACSR